MVTSNQGHELPFIKTKLEYKPCMIPQESSINPTAEWYPTERTIANDFKKGCQFSSLNNYQFDDRYLSLGMPVTTYDIQSHSGVLSRIKNFHESTRYYNTSIENAKKTDEKHFWARPTISWNLHCQE